MLIRPFCILPKPLVFLRARSASSMSTRVPIPTDMKIQLTDAEDRICTLLDDCTKYLLQEKAVSVTCRIAGGWVRDKV
ncbi:hypothetical protein BDQ17DRAFT_1209165, partial [Cyathus striatus]